MNRRQLEHIVRASAGITGADTFVIIGSQAILGQYPSPPPELAESMEVDIFTLRDPNDAVLIDGSIGEASPFHRTFGYYAHGVGEETATLPSGWKERLVPVRNDNTNGATGLCLEVHDLAVSKLVAGREKDLDFLKELLHRGMAVAETIFERLEQTAIDDVASQVCRNRLSRALN